jgi:YHS domain-containing protein
MKHILVLVLALAMSATFAFAEDTTPATEEVSAAGKYPLTTCPVSGETLGEMGDPVVKVYDGREVKFCCKNCVGTFEKDLASSMNILNEKIYTAQKDAYPLKTCVVSGEHLGGMGDPYPYMYKNRLVMFCCENCVKSFEKEPDKYLSMIDNAAVAPAQEEHKE